MKSASLKLATNLVLAIFSTLSVTHCGGDDDPAAPPATGGSAGRGGSGGESGEAGSSAGTSGSSGRGSGGTGEGGEAGNGQAGTGSPGVGGTGGTSGTGGTGAVSGTGGGAGETSGAGMGGDGSGGQPDQGANACALGCDSEDDCASTSADVRRCVLDIGRCVECVSHEDCIPVASAWVTTCVEDDGCFVALGEVCVDVGGTGRCAPAYDSGLGCLFPGEVPITLPKFAVAETVQVCGKDTGRCEGNRCFTGCADDPNYCTTGLNVGYGDSCDVASGRCTCESDSECTHGPERCNPTTNRCDECGDAGDCAGAGEGKDVCVDGRCGCSSASVCGSTTFPAATPLCE